MLNIAIDGPSGAGKSTLAKALARRLGCLYVDTGALYRSIGLAALRAGADTKNADAMAGLLPGLQLALRHEADGQHVYLGGEDVSEAIREERVSMAASDVSAHGVVRDYLLETQRRLAREQDVIMDGRDIGTVVLPGANVKVFLTASAEERARRRTRQLHEQGREADYETVLADVQQRDYNDSHRAIAPLKPAEDAVVLDTSAFSFEESLAALEEIVRKAQEGA